MPGELVRIEGTAVCQEDVEAVPGVGVASGLGKSGFLGKVRGFRRMGERRAEGNFKQIAGGLNHAFGEEKTGGEIPVVARGAHHHGDGAAFHSEGQGGLGGHGIAEVLPLEAICR